MALSRKLMVEGERVLLTTRTHAKALTLPVLVLLLTSAAAGFLLAVSSNSSAAGVLRVVILVVDAAVLLLWVVLPFLRWLTWTYTLTTLRLVEQKGLLTRTGRVIPLSRVNDVSFEKNLNDRLLGSGTLIVHDASEQAGMRLDDVPHVEDVHRTMTELVLGGTGGAGGTGPAGRGDDERA